MTTETMTIHAKATSGAKTSFADIVRTFQQNVMSQNQQRRALKNADHRILEDIGLAAACMRLAAVQIRKFLPSLANPVLETRAHLK